MKKNKYILIAVAGLLGATFFTTKLNAAECAMPACCGGVQPQTVADSKAKPYPLDTCIVSGEKLGEMGKPFTFVYKDQEIKLCCKGCKKDFDKNPDKFLKKLADNKK